MSLSAYLAECIAALKAAPSIDLFIRLRYYDLIARYPHGIFSVGQAHISFFDKALAHLHGAPFDSMYQPSVYEMNYRRWIEANRA